MRKHFPYLIIVIFSAIVLTAATKVIGPADLFQLNPTTIPSSGNAGALRYDTSANAFKFYNGTSWGEIGGGVTALSVTSKTTTYTATNADNVILNDATSAAYTVTLFTAVGNTGHQLYLKKTDSSSNLITIDANSTETIDGGLTFVLDSQYDEINLISDGTNWIITEVKLHGLVESTSTIVNFPITVTQYGDLTSISLAQGDWDISIHAVVYSNGTTSTTTVFLGVSTTSGNSGAGLTEGSNLLYVKKRTTSGTYEPITLLPYRVSPTSTTTYYLKTRANTSITNLQIGYKISARRKN